jgi:hypothetical protein
MSWGGETIRPTACQVSHKFEPSHVSAMANGRTPTRHHVAPKPDEAIVPQSQPAAPAAFRLAPPSAATDTDCMNQIVILLGAPA